jgi:large subunit ribosomal protein L17
MRHRVPKNQLARPYDQRKALLRSLATELLRHDEIFTTLSKAKAVRGEAEKMITLAKRAKLSGESKDVYAKAKSGDAGASKELAKHVHSRRQMASYLYDAEVVKRVYDVVAPRYEAREGGYTRIIRAGYRRGDAAPMAIIQLV